MHAHARRSRGLAFALVATLALGAGTLTACDGEVVAGGTAAGGAGEPAFVPPTNWNGTMALADQLVDEPPDRCDPLVVGCLAPFPSDFYTVPDRSTSTGRRVHLVAESLPANSSGVHADPKHLNESDGFSPSSAVVLQIPGIDLAATGTAPITDMGRSLRADAPVVLLDATSRRRIPYWVELDSNAEAGSVPTFYVRPATVLPEGHRIVVALRNLKDGSGAAIAPSNTFRAYRDRIRTDVPVVEKRRLAMERVFFDLLLARVPRRSLTLAWDFTVASQRSLSERLLHIRDDAFRRLGGNAPSFTVTSNTPSGRTGIAREVAGTYEVPLYLSNDGRPGSEFVFDRRGLPTHTGTYTAKFRCIVPTSATAANPAAAGLYGHGLLGTAGQVGAASTVAATGNRIFCGTDLIGMAEEDIPNAIGIIQDLSKFNTLADRLQQGHLNTLVLGRLMIAPDGLGSDPAFQDAGTSLLTRNLVYYGISQGGIMGAATTAVAQDWDRAVLGVPAANYGLLLDRSIDFDAFRLVLNPSYPKAADRAVGLQIIQMLWDRGEGAGYLQHLTSRPYRRTPTHRVLLHVAFGDHQVANVATEVEARAIGAKKVTPVLAPGRSPDTEVYWGIEPITRYPYKGSAIVMWDSGAARPPLGNVPPREGDDPHGDPRADPKANQQIVHFFDTREVIEVCGGVPCTAAPR